jgi:hypothetical protein
MKKLLIAIFWIACGIFNYGATLCHFTNRFPDQNNRYVARIFAIAGPLGSLMPLATFEGFRWKPMTKEESWQAFHKKMPDLDREYFDSYYEGSSL